jgi:histidinol-phosphatase (PHP family)
MRFMTIDTDFHAHVVRSSARQMAQSAQDRGLRVLGLSEHVFQMSEARAPLEHMQLEGSMLPFSSYIEAVYTAAQDTHFDVRLGLEVDFIPAKNEHIQSSLQGYPWDYLIGSVHEVDGTQFEDASDLTSEQGEMLWLRYFQLLREAASSGYFSLISHPVRMRVNNPHMPVTIDDELERLAAEAARRDIALELNGFDILTYPDLVYRLARACALHQTPISVGSDAHKPGQVAQSHTQTEAVLREVGIHTVRIWKQRIPQEYRV